MGRSCIIALKASRVTVSHRTCPDPNLQGHIDVEADSSSHAYQDRSVSETERGHGDTQAGSPGMNPPSTINDEGEGEGEALDPAMASNAGSRPFAKSDAERGAPDLSPLDNLEKKPEDVECSSGQSISSDASLTRSTQKYATVLTRAHIDWKYSDRVRHPR